MEGDDNQQSAPMPVLPRLDRLDRLVRYLEEKRNLPERHPDSFPANEDLDKQCKPLSSALDEVHSKGTLMERVAMLENRVLKLSLEMEQGSTSSSSTILAPEYTKHDFPTVDNRKALHALDERLDQDTVQKREFEEAWTHKYQDCKKSSRQKRTLRSRKWLQWLQMGC